MKIQVWPEWANIPLGETGIDEECVGLCEALNLLLGIKTVESCCGHGSMPFRIWFKADRIEDLPSALYFFDGCHSGFLTWLVVATTDCGMSPVKFRVEGPIGQLAYEQANHIAKLIKEYVETEVTDHELSVEELKKLPPEPGEELLGLLVDEIRAERS